MRSFRIVVDSPLLNDFSGTVKVDKHIVIQTLISELAVKAFNISYYRLSRQRIEEFKFGSAQFSACFQVCLFKNSFEVDLSRSHVTK